MHDHIFTTRERFALLGLVLVQAFLLSLILPPASRHSDVLRVAAPARERVLTRLSPYGPGFEQELLAAFCNRYGYEMRWVKADDRHQALRLVAGGRADVAVGFGVMPEDETGTPGLMAPGARPEKVSANAPGGSLGALLALLTTGADQPPLSGMVSGPAYDHARPVLMRWSEAAPPEPVTAAPRNAGGYPHPALLPGAGSVPFRAAAPGSLPPSRGPVVLDAGASGDIFGTAPPGDQAGDQVDGRAGGPDAPVRHAMVDGDSWRLWQPFMAKPTAGRATGASLSYRWYWRDDNATLAPRLAEFWQLRMAPADTLLDDLTERYFGFLPESLAVPKGGDGAGPADIFDLMDLLAVVAEKLPDHAASISLAASRNNIDPLLLSAVIFQESRFNASARSKTGVRGIMQLTQSTALLLKVNRMNPDQSIRGGARYLRMVWDSLEDLDLELWDRWFFTLAAFNQGPGHLRDAIRLDRELGGSGRTWRELKETFPKLARPRYHTRTRYGYCRGYEAVAFVESVRYYYYILNGLVALSRPEAEHLAPLLGAIPVRRPMA